MKVVRQLVLGGLVLVLIIVGMVLTLMAVRGMSKNPLFEVLPGADVTTTKRLFNFSPLVGVSLWGRLLLWLAGIGVVACIVVALMAFKQSATRLFAGSFDLGFVLYLAVFQQLLPSYCYRFWQQTPEPLPSFQLATPAIAQQNARFRWLRTVGLILIAGGATSFFFI